MHELSLRYKFLCKNKIDHMHLDWNRVASIILITLFYVNAFCFFDHSNWYKNGKEQIYAFEIISNIT